VAHSVLPSRQVGHRRQPDRRLDRGGVLLVSVAAELPRRQSLRVDLPRSPTSSAFP
jgi:hypothetical protein